MPLAGGDARARLEAIVAEYGGLVRAVCRRYFRSENEIDDAAQATFLKLARHVGQIHSSPKYWVCTTARNACVDMIRQAARQRKALDEMVRGGTAGAGEALLGRDAYQQLDTALSQLDEQQRRLVHDRFFRAASFSDLAREQRVCKSTMHRQLLKTMRELRRSLAELGAHDVDDLFRFEHMPTVGDVPPGLLAMDPFHDPDDGPVLQRDMGYLIRPESSGVAAKPILIGVLISRATLMEKLLTGSQTSLETQLRSALEIWSPHYQLVALVEPGSEDFGPVERGMRDYRVLGGLMDATDRRTLQSLDVIYLGQAVGVPRKVLEAIADAVEFDGVGLYNENWTVLQGWPAADPIISRLLLTERYSSYHTHPCHRMVPAKVNCAHPSLPGLKAGTVVRVSGCGQCFLPDPARSTVIVSHVDPVAPNRNTHVGVRPGRIPVLVAGQIGKGRTFIVNTRPRTSSDELFSGDVQPRLPEVIDWLAKPSD